MEDAYWYAVWAAPCASSAFLDLAYVANEDSGALFDLWRRGGEARPVPASWEGIAAAAREAYDVTAPLPVWWEMAHAYSFSGGDLGLGGKVRTGNFYLEQCTFGTYASSGCCSAGETDPSFLRLAGAWDNPSTASGGTSINFDDPAVLRAYLANNLALGPFFNGDGYTYNGCYGYYSILSSTEYLVPNKHEMQWGNGTDYVQMDELVQGGEQGLIFSWGPSEKCSEFEGACDYTDGMSLPKERCEQEYGQLPAQLVPLVYGGDLASVAPC